MRGSIGYSSEDGSQKGSRNSNQTTKKHQMSEAPEKVWIIPGDPLDMAPLPVLKYGDNLFSNYHRRKQVFLEPYEHVGFLQTYSTFEECRKVMLDIRSKTLDEANQYCRQLAASIEHIRTIPIATFPSVNAKVRQDGQEQGQEKAQAQEKASNANEKVKSALVQKPSRD